MREGALQPAQVDGTLRRPIDIGRKLTPIRRLRVKSTEVSLCCRGRKPSFACRAFSWGALRFAPDTHRGSPPGVGPVWDRTIPSQNDLGPTPGRIRRSRGLPDREPPVQRAARAWREEKGWEAGRTQSESGFCEPVNSRVSAPPRINQEARRADTVVRPAGHGRP